MSYFYFSLRELSVCCGQTGVWAGGGDLWIEKKLTVLVICIRLVFAKSFTLKELFRPTLRSVFELPAGGGGGITRLPAITFN